MRNALALLAGEPPGSPHVPRENLETEFATPALTAPDPLALLSHRPDVRDAWLQRRNYQIENDLRGKRERGSDDANSPIPVDAMPMPQWTN